MRALNPKVLKRSSLDFVAAMTIHTSGNRK